MNLALMHLRVNSDDVFLSQGLKKQHHQLPPDSFADETGQ